MLANHTNFAIEENSNSLKPKEGHSVPSDVSSPARLKERFLWHWFPLEKTPEKIFHGFIRSSNYTFLNKRFPLRSAYISVSVKVSFDNIGPGAWIIITFSDRVPLYTCSYWKWKWKIKDSIFCFFLNIVINFKVISVKYLCGHLCADVWIRVSMATESRGIGSQWKSRWQWSRWSEDKQQNSGPLNSSTHFSPSPTSLLFYTFHEIMPGHTSDKQKNPKNMFLKFNLLYREVKQWSLFSDSVCRAGIPYFPSLKHWNHCW